MRLTTLTAALGLTAAALMTPISAGGAGAAGVPLALTSAKVTVEGTSNVHDWTASTTAVQVTAVELAGSEGDVLETALQPGALKAFDVTIPAKTLTSPRDGIDKNMHKALKVTEHPEIRFRLRGLEAAGPAYSASGTLTIAGVEKDVVLALQVQRQGAVLAVSGAANLLMTDFGVKPPSAMLGMVKASPKITVKLELTVAAS